MIPLNDCIRISKELAHAFEGETFTVLEPGDYPACAVSSGGRQLLLVRHFGSSFTVSLPLESSFSFRFAAGFEQALPEIVQATEAFRKKYPTCMTIADAALVLKPAVLAVHPEWILDFPGTPVPAEAWLKSGSYHIGLFQEKAGVNVIVWVGSAPHTFYAGSPKKLDELSAWIVPQLQAQAIKAEETDAEERRITALGPPALSEVLAALQKGARMQLGAGRWYETYFLADGKLRREIFDEGAQDEEDATEKQLADAMKAHIRQAREQLGK